MKNRFQTLKSDISTSTPFGYRIVLPSFLHKRTKNKKLQEFLNNIQWQKKKFTTNELKAILVKNGLWYLKGLVSLDFLLGLEEEIRQTYGTAMEYELQEITNILHLLCEKIQSKEISTEAKEVIHKIVNEAQKTITRKDSFDIIGI